MQVDVVDRQRARRVRGTALARFTRRLAAAVPPRGASTATICLAGDRFVRRLNRDHRRIDRTTDVLSFPGDRARLPDGSRHLGDVVISVPQAGRQARRAGHSLEREVRILAIHGYLHLLGYDHEVDDGAMMRLQARLVRRLL